MAKQTALLFIAFITLLFIGQTALAADPPVTYTSTTLPFDANTATPRADWPSGLTPITSLSLDKSDPATVIFASVNTFLSLLGLAFLVLLLYAGVVWVLARGNEEDITRAKTILIRALIGLAIILSSYGLSYITFIFITNATFS